jgi:hypothetical protein
MPSPGSASLVRPPGPRGRRRQNAIVGREADPVVPESRHDIHHVVDGKKGLDEDGTAGAPVPAGPAVSVPRARPRSLTNCRRSSSWLTGLEARRPPEVRPPGWPVRVRRMARTPPARRSRSTTAEGMGFTTGRGRIRVGGELPVHALPAGPSRTARPGSGSRPSGFAGRRCRRKARRSPMARVRPARERARVLGRRGRGGSTTSRSWPPRRRRGESWRSAAPGVYRTVHGVRGPWPTRVRKPVPVVAREAH